MNKKETFEECINVAIDLGRPYMTEYLDNTPTQQEWDLALMLFEHKLKEELLNE